jgi:hypothetical protein
MELLGTIVRLQIQESSLKVGDKPRRYDPAPLRVVSSLLVTPAGVVASDADGSPLIDVHHQDHPASKNREGENGISLGFTGHYRAMRDRFGPHLVDGIAGENILIEAERQFPAEELARGVVVIGEEGRYLPLTDIIVAAPCVEFTRFAMRFPDDARLDATVTTALKFLHNGMRGFYARLGGETATILLGDRVFLA